MEVLMNKIVQNPSFVNDDNLNQKVAAVQNMKAFQNMVDNADVF